MTDATIVWVGRAPFIAEGSPDDVAALIARAQRDEAFVRVGDRYINPARVEYLEASDKLDLAREVEILRLSYLPSSA